MQESSEGNSETFEWQKKFCFGWLRSQIMLHYPQLYICIFDKKVTPNTKYLQISFAPTDWIWYLFFLPNSRKLCPFCKHLVLNVAWISAASQLANSLGWKGLRMWGARVLIKNRRISPSFCTLPYILSPLRMTDFGWENAYNRLVPIFRHR